MANSFLDYALSLIGVKPANTSDIYDSSVYRPEAVPINSASTTENKPEVIKAKQAEKLTGVEKYLAQNRPEKVAVNPEPENVESLSGVALYLAKKQQVEQSAMDNMTGVEQYLFNLKSNAGNKPLLRKIPEKTKPPEKLSRVDQYLARKPRARTIKPSVGVSNEPQYEEREHQPSTVEDWTQKTSVEGEVNESLESASVAVQDHQSTAQVIDFASGVKQCQAATLKLTQCSRKTNLETIERTINSQLYRFAVCNQHNKDSFIPFEKI